MKYVERLKLSNEQLNQSTATSRAAETEAELASKISSLSALRVRLGNKKESILNNYPLNVDSIRTAQAEINDVISQIEDLEEIKEELFGEE